MKFNHNDLFCSASITKHKEKKLSYNGVCSFYEDIFNDEWAFNMIKTIFHLYFK